MSQENIELVRRVMTEFNETQQPSGFLAADFIWDLRSWPVWTGQAEYHGADGFREFFAEWTGAYEEWTNEIESITSGPPSSTRLRTG